MDVSLIPNHLALTVGIAAAIFALGLLAWWRNRWTRGGIVVMLMAFVMAFWTSVEWFRVLAETVLPHQAFIWRVIYELTIALGPALAWHAARIAGHRRLGVGGVLVYAASAVLFVMLDSGLLWSASESFRPFGVGLFEIAALVLTLMYLGVLIAASVELFPALFLSGASHAARRHAAYATVILSVFSVAGVRQFATVSEYGLHVSAVLGALFFVAIARGFVRSAVFDVDLTDVEPFFISLTAAAAVLLLRSSSLDEVLSVGIASLVVGLFGVLAVHSVRRERRFRRLAEGLIEKHHDFDARHTDFVATVAHQLRSPIGGIRFASDMLARGNYGSLPERARQVIELIRHSADRLLEMGETALKAAHLETGTFVLAPSEVDVAKEIQALVSDIRPFAAAKGVDIEAMTDDLPETGLIDRDAFRTILFNLIDNAVKYTDHGRVTVSAGMEDDRLLISVADMGPGIHSDDANALFSRFSRGKNALTRAKSGTGLGLYVVKRLSEKLGGEIQVESGDGRRGAVFTVSIPCESR